MEMASPLEPKVALMHCLFPLMLTINMNGLGVVVIIVKKSFFLELFVNVYGEER